MTVSALAALIGLGAFHGINPAMGWLFAVARAMQEQSRRALLTALPAIAAGHLASVAIVAALVTATQSVLATQVVSIGGGVLLVGFGLWRLLSQRHFRWTGMRLSTAQLAGWSFLMSSAHGAGLMLLPVLVSSPMASTDHSGHSQLAQVGPGALTGLAAAGLHTLAMFAVAAAVALLVYEVVGLGILRRAWFNLDKLWAGVLVAAGVLTIVTAG